LILFVDVDPERNPYGIFDPFPCRLAVPDEAPIRDSFHDGNYKRVRGRGALSGWRKFWDHAGFKYPAGHSSTYTEGSMGERLLGSVERGNADGDLRIRREAFVHNPMCQVERRYENSPCQNGAD
jgi:hypothetical protein